MADFPAALNWLETDRRLLPEVRDTVNSNEDFRMFERFLNIHDDDREVEFSQICGYEEVKRKLFYISLTTRTTFRGFQVEGANPSSFTKASSCLVRPVRKELLLIVKMRKFYLAQILPHLTFL